MLTVMRASVAIIAVLAAVALTACNSSQELRPPDAEASLRGKPCPEPKMRDGVRAFLSAANKGDTAALELSLARQPAFRVFSAGFEYGSKPPKKFFSSKNRSKVIDKLLRRYALGDRYRPRSLHRTGYDGAFKICGVAFVIERRIAGGPWKPFVGKGALDAKTGTVAVWNVGGEVAP
jgi:hypothetical protein